jgi:hypothetical protein
VNQGDSEVREALLAKAEFFARIGKREEAVAALKATEEKVRFHHAGAVRDKEMGSKLHHRTINQTTSASGRRRWRRSRRRRRRCVSTTQGQ